MRVDRLSEARKVILPCPFLIISSRLLPFSPAPSPETTVAHFSLDVDQWIPNASLLTASPGKHKAAKRIGFFWDYVFPTFLVVKLWSFLKEMLVIVDS